MVAAIDQVNVDPHHHLIVDASPPSSAPKDMHGSEILFHFLLNGFIQGTGTISLDCGRGFSFQHSSWEPPECCQSDEGKWRYVIFGQACCHLGLMEVTMTLLQTHHRLATAASLQYNTAIDLLPVGMLKMIDLLIINLRA